MTAEQLIGKFQEALDAGWGYIWGTAGVKWTAAKQAAIEKTTDAKRAMARKYGSKWIGHMVADCSGLFVWAFKAFGQSIYHGSNTMYLRYCSDKGKLKAGRREDGSEPAPGTAVFVYNKKKENYSHVGLYIGDGWVIEAAGTVDGVCRSRITNSKWSNWGWLKGVEGGEVPVGKPVLRKGDRGEYVKLAQTELIEHGYDVGKWGADGVFGAATEAAVKQFQKDNGLSADGVIGPKTWDALDDVSVALYTVTIPHLAKHHAEALVNNYDGATMTEERG